MAAGEKMHFLIQGQCSCCCLRGCRTHAKLFEWKREHTEQLIPPCKPELDQRPQRKPQVVPHMVQYSRLCRGQGTWTRIRFATVFAGREFKVRDKLSCECVLFTAGTSIRSRQSSSKLNLWNFFWETIERSKFYFFSDFINSFLTFPPTLASFKGIQNLRLG